MMVFMMFSVKKPVAAPRSGGLNSTSSSPQLRGEPVPCAPRPERYRRAAQLLQGAFEMTEVSPGRSWCLGICWCYMDKHDKLEYPSREAGADIWYPKHTKTIQNVDKAEALKLNLVLEYFDRFTSLIMRETSLNTIKCAQSSIPASPVAYWFVFYCGMLIHDFCWWKKSRPATWDV